MQSSSPAGRKADASVEAGSATGSTGGASPISSGDPPIIFVDAGHGSPSGDGAAFCAAEVHQAEGRKLDLLVLMDGSGSMKDEIDGGARKWDLLVAALRDFLNDDESSGIGVGLTYFGIPAGYDAGDLVVSCDVTEYVNPAVAIHDLPANAGPLVDSLANYTPVGGTPTRPALAGALEYANQWSVAHPTHRVAIVVATDGEPNDCESTVDSVSTVAAAAARATPSISVYVIGVGTSLMRLDQVASAGGTGHAYVVDPSYGTTASFVAAMNAIRSRAALPCEYGIPKASSGESIDFERVNVVFTGGTDAGDAAKTVLLQVPDASACSATEAGWYYDDPSAPKSIELCPASCTRAKADIAGRVDVLVGCKTQSAVTR
jgi:hypothetical protein